jgi:predicted permease
METLLHDLRYAARMLRKTPGFTAVAVLTLALGIGANAAMFAVLDAALLREIPVAQPGQLYIIQTGTPGGGSYSDFSYPLYQDFRDRTDVFSGVFGYTIGSFGVSTTGSTERVIGEYVGGNYFDTLGVRPALGSSFGLDDERAGNLAVVISHGLWQRAFGGASDAIGKSFMLNGRAATVAGVAPRGFTGMVRGYAPDLWLPLSTFAQFNRAGEERLNSRNFSWMSLAGRLKPGFTPEQAAAKLTAVARSFEPERAPEADWRVVLVGASRGDTGAVEDLGRPLVLLMAAVGLILAIACANLANLLLARAGARQREIAVRRALGATRPRLVRQLLTESLVLSMMGGGLGLLIAGWGADLASTLRNASGSRVSLGVALDDRVLLFTAVITFATAVVFGILPALRASSPDLIPALKDVTTSTPRRTAVLKDALAVAQVALSLVLLVGAGLFLRSLWHLQGVSNAVVAQDAVAATINLQLLGYSQERGLQFYEQALERIGSTAGIEAASFAFVLPVTSGGMRMNLNPNSTLPQVEGKVEFDINPVAPRFFETVGLSLLRGRDFRSADREGAAQVAIVNESFARRFWPGRDPLGERFSTLDEKRAVRESYEIVGLVRDSKYRNLREQPRMVMYRPIGQSYEAAGALIVRSSVGADHAMGVLREQLRAIDPQLPVYNIRTLREHIGSSVYLDRLKAVLLSLFGGLALLLSAIGVYGLLSYNVVNRTREIGIRMALGAQRRDVLGMVLGGGLRLALIGLTLGLIAALWLSRLVASQLFEVGASDPVSLAAAAAVLLAMALVASLIPARRATKVDPMVALRYE